MLFTADSVATLVIIIGIVVAFVDGDTLVGWRKHDGVSVGVGVGVRKRDSATTTVWLLLRQNFGFSVVSKSSLERPANSEINF